MKFEEIEREIMKKNCDALAMASVVYLLDKFGGDFEKCAKELEFPLEAFLMAITFLYNECSDTDKMWREVILDGLQ